MNIAPLINSQFPEFYNIDGETFMSFVKAYYEFLDSSGNESRNILSYRNIDETVDEFISHFFKEYLLNFPYDTAIDKTTLIKHIQDLYKTKGSTESFKLAFKILFNEDIEIYDPGKDVLRPSDGIWIVPQYIECSPTDIAFTFIGKQLIGATSSAQAFVENVIRKKINGRFIDVIYLSSIKGSFQTGEYVTTTNSLEGAPFITGSLNTIDITLGGANNKIGDVYTLSGASGKGGKAIVREVVNGTGKSGFTLRESGYGYQLTSNVIVSNSVITIQNTNGVFAPFTTLIQPLYSLSYSTLTGNTFNVLDRVSAYNAANTAVANGYIVSINTTGPSTGNVIISVTGGDWSIANTVRLSSNSSVNAVSTATSNVSVRAIVNDSNSSAIGLYSITGTLYDKAYVKGYIPVALGLATSNVNTPNVSGTGTVFSSAQVGDTLFYRANNSPIGEISSITSNTALVLTANSKFNLANVSIMRTNYVAVANTIRVYSTGTGASYSVGALGNTETMIINTDRISANNANGVPFLDMLISGSNANTGSGYGFVANPVSNLSSVILGALSTNTVTIGEVAGISRINPGNNYAINPMSVIIEPLTSGYYEPDVVLYLSNTNSLFSPGQLIYQDISLNRNTLTMGSNTGAFRSYEGIIQTTSGARGTVISANSTTLTLEVVSGTFVTSNNITGQVSGATATISGVSPFTSFVKADGVIRAVNGNSVSVKPESFAYSFSVGNVYSVDSNMAVQGLGNVSSISYDYSNRNMGFNAGVNSVVQSPSGIVTKVEILDSGFGHANNDAITLIKTTNSSITISGTARVSRQGKSEGYWKNNNGKLNSDKYIHDNKYYQEYSYEIQSSLSLDTYKDLLKNLLHMAGTEMFGKTIIRSENNIQVDTPGIRIEIT